MIANVTAVEASQRTTSRSPERPAKRRRRTSRRPGPGGSQPRDGRGRRRRGDSRCSTLTERHIAWSTCSATARWQRGWDRFVPLRPTRLSTRGSARSGGRQARPDPDRRSPWAGRPACHPKPPLSFSTSRHRPEAPVTSAHPRPPADRVQSNVNFCRTTRCPPGGRGSGTGGLVQLDGASRASTRSGRIRYFTASARPPAAARASRRGAARIRAKGSARASNGSAPPARSMASSPAGRACPTATAVVLNVTVTNVTPRHTSRCGRRGRACRAHRTSTAAGRRSPTSGLRIGAGGALSSPTSSPSRRDRRRVRLIV